MLYIKYNFIFNSQTSNKNISKKILPKKVILNYESKSLNFEKINI